MAADTVGEFQRWLSELIDGEDFSESSGELPAIEIALLSRAIDEIKRWRWAGASPIDSAQRANANVEQRAERRTGKRMKLNSIAASPITWSSRLTGAKTATSSPARRRKQRVLAQQKEVPANWR